MDWAIIFSAASLILCGCSFLYFKSYLRRRTGSERLLAEFREEVYKLIAEIDAATDKDALLVEERIKTLRTVLEDVDKRIGLHIREIDRRRFQEEAYAELGRKRSIIGSIQSVPLTTPKAAELFPAPAKAVPAPESPPAAVPEEPRAENPRIVVSPNQIEPKPPPVREQILELSKAGLDTRLIALRLGIGIAEVETTIAIAEDL
ncbi:MAG: hypothetical protein LBG73_01220 [Spirochaetaceae bacterium]|jgi:hypothetical protein|nr:hypothetical protein [Spirochaetaceae bacterium]